ncbi:MAG: hypothetical protein JWR59_614 [Brevundimonas sp.]|nr:hypothetical protein [Brevundimonas sp.]
MSALKWPNRYDDELLDYQVDWTARLAGDEIVGEVTAEPSAGSSLEASSISTADGVTTLWLSGGGPGPKLASVHLVATTTGGRKIAETVRISILTT